MAEKFKFCYWHTRKITDRWTKLDTFWIDLCPTQAQCFTSGKNSKPYWHLFIIWDEIDLYHFERINSLKEARCSTNFPSDLLKDYRYDIFYNKLSLREEQIQTSILDLKCERDHSSSCWILCLREINMIKKCPRPSRSI